MKKIVHFVQDESGATAIEYGLIAAAIGLMLVSVLPGLRNNLEARFTDITDALGSANFTTNNGGGNNAGN